MSYSHEIRVDNTFHHSVLKNYWEKSWRYHFYMKLMQLFFKCRPLLSEQRHE